VGGEAVGTVLTDEHSVVARYRNHAQAEDAVRLLHKGGIEPNKVSIIGRDFEMREDVQGFYRPSDRVAEGARGGTWVGGFFGLFAGLAFFVFPGFGPLFILGPLAGAIVGALGGAGIGALISGLMSLGIDREKALRYQAHLQAGQFLVVVHGTQDEVQRAREILAGSESEDVGVFRRGAAASSD
jgi:hypothetical protein